MVCGLEVYRGFFWCSVVGPWALMWPEIKDEENFTKATHYTQV